MNEHQWYFAIQGQQKGPFSFADMRARLASGEIGPATYVFKQGMTNWVPLSEIPELTTTPSSGAPTPPPPSPMGRSGHFDFNINGNEMQYVEIELDSQETVIAEAGGMMYMETGIEMEARFGDGSKPDQGFAGKLFEGIKRKLTQESLFMTWFTNKGIGKKRVAFGAPYPGKIIHINLSEVGGEFLCQKDAFLCAALGTEVGIAFNRKIGAGLFGGEGFIMQRLRGQGRAFVHAGGTIVERDLAPGETLKVDTGCIVGYTNTVNYDIQRAGGLKSMLLGGEGLFFATLTGPGKIWLQTLPFSRLAGRIYAAAPQTGGASRGEGSILGGLGNLLDGD